MASLASRLADDIRKADPYTVDEKIEETIRDYPRRLQLLQAQTVPQFWGGNNGVAVAAYTETLETLRRTLIPLIGWDLMPDAKAMPAQLSRRLRSIQADIERIVPDKELLERQAALIAEAHEAAEELPLDLQSLREARDRVGRLVEEATRAAGRARSDADESSKQLEAIISEAVEAEKLVAQCAEAYRVTTSTGLAAAFDQRAAALGRSTTVWVVGLIGALTVGATIGSMHLRELSIALDAREPKWNVVALHVVLSALSIAAPVWFAWLATKQVGQRFRLAEDYAFKASVAKAYEGYRREAARIDPQFESRLFASALSRLEEAPLRLVETETHGSPWHELLESDGFQKALAVVPELRQSMAATVAKAVAPSKRVEGGARED